MLGGHQDAVLFIGAIEPADPISGGPASSGSPTGRQGVEVSVGMINEAHPDVAGRELAAVAASLEGAPAPEIIGWAVERFGAGLSLACSFQDLVVLDLAHQVDPGVEVVFLDTGAHFPETLQFVEEMSARYSLNLTVLRPGPDADAWPCGSARCCEVRKVEPLRRHLSARAAWMTGVRRVEAPTRAETPVVSYDRGFGVVKVNPLAAWGDEEIAAYVARRQLPVHPLVPQGYLSIGCAPTTRPVSIGEDPRAGRWSGTAKTECGLHA